MKKTKHAKALEEIVLPENLEKIRENPRAIRLIITEPIYQQIRSADDIVCPDMFIGYYNNYWTVLELKSSISKRDKAISQIISGARLVNSAFNVPMKNIIGKFVTYGQEFNYERIIRW